MSDQAGEPEVLMSTADFFEKVRANYAHLMGEGPDRACRVSDSQATARLGQVHHGQFHTWTSTLGGRAPSGGEAA